MKADRISTKAIWGFFAICGGALVLFLGATGIRAESVEPALTLEAKVPLGDVSGRIDHMAIDPKRQRLFVAELGNNTVGVVDLKERKVIHDGGISQSCRARCVLRARWLRGRECRVMWRCRRCFRRCKTPPCLHELRQPLAGRV